MTVDPGIVELTDLWNREQLKRWVKPLEHLGRVTCYGRPNMLGPVHDLTEEYPWVTFGMQGFEGVMYECNVWTDALAEKLIRQALDMGYAPLFLPPGWVHDEETVEACKELGVTIRNHPGEVPRADGVRMFPGVKEQRTKVKHFSVMAGLQRVRYGPWVGAHPSFQPGARFPFQTTLTPLEAYVEVKCPASK